MKNNMQRFVAIVGIGFALLMHPRTNDPANDRYVGFFAPAVWKT
jgi:hypothetical protein